MDPKCIYCNSTDLSISDIFSCFMSSKKIVKKFVCNYHNNLVSQKYESDVAKTMSVVRNFMSLRSSKNKELTFTAKVTIDSEEITVNNFTGIADLFWNNTNGKRHDNSKYKFKMENLSSDLNVKVRLDETSLLNCIDEFFSDKMKRIAAKIAYEFYCLKNDINDYKSAYSDIVNYIIGTASKNLVEIADMGSLGKNFNDALDLGNNTIFEYTDFAGTTFIVLYLWNIVGYKIKICESKILRPNCQIENLESYRYDGSKVTVRVSKLSQFFGVAAVSDYSLTKSQIPIQLETLSKEHLFTEKSNRIMYNKIENVIKSTRTDKEKLLYLSCVQDANIMSFNYVIIKLYQKQNEYNMNVSFNDNLKVTFNTDEQVLINKKKFIELLNELGNDYLQTLQKALDFYNGLDKKNWI